LNIVEGKFRDEKWKGGVDWIVGSFLDWKGFIGFFWNLGIFFRLGISFGDLRC
jgi:hypothetical protein